MLTLGGAGEGYMGTTRVRPIHPSTWSLGQPVTAGKKDLQLFGTTKMIPSYIVK